MAATLCDILRMKYVLAILFLVPVAAFATDRPVSPEEFERLVTGKTYSYANGLSVYGAETYFENRRVRWSFLDGKCTDGEWYVQGEQICFVYDDIPNPQCWQFYMVDGSLTARFENDPQASQLYQTLQRDEPLYCPAPFLGV